MWRNPDFHQTNFFWMRSLVLLVIFLILAGIVIYVVARLSGHQAHHPHHPHHDVAVDVLRTRLANGEISVDEFETRMAALVKHQP
jgi:uncharacterized membrane protein